MAGSLKPDGVGKEIKITIDLMGSSYTDSKDTLSNGILDTAVYRNAVLMELGNYFVFTINKRCNLWAITGYYSDSGGWTADKPVRLYRIDNNGSEILVGDYPTVNTSLGRQFGKWYKLFSDLPKGTYKLTAINHYVGFQEFYGEAKESYLYLKDNAVHGIKAVE